MQGFPQKVDEELMVMLYLAREGNEQAQQYLFEKHHLQIYTNQEVGEINKLILERGLTTEQAIKQLGKEKVWL